MVFYFCLSDNYTPFLIVDEINRYNQLRLSYIFKESEQSPG